MPSKTKQDVITAIANRIFDDMVSELQFDTILKARQDADKAKRPCRCCGTQLSCIDAQVAELLTLDCHTTSYPSYLLFLKVVLYVSDYDSSTETHRPMPVATAHTPGASASANSSTTRLSAIQQPASQNKSAISSSSGSGTPTKDGGNILLKCPICNRQFASNRVAAHLATCMGISTGSRRGARTAKAKMEDRSASPYVELPDDPMSSSQKAKSKKKDANGNGKRPPSPSIIDTPTKKLKKQKTISEHADNASVSSSQPPSSLRKSSTTSSIFNGAASSSSASSYTGEGEGSPMDTDSPPSTQGQTPLKSITQKPKPKMATSVSASSVPPASRGPPGSSKGRAIAVARLHGEGDIAMAES